MPLLVFSGGEPLCRDDLFELIPSARSRGIKCALATNGTLIDAAMADKIKTAGFERVAVSLDGATASVHNSMRVLDGAFESSIQGIEHLRGCQIPFQINMTITRQNAHQLDGMFALARRLDAVAIHFFMLVPVGCGEEIPKSEMLSPKEYEILLTQIAETENTDGLEVKVTCAPHYETYPASAEYKERSRFQRLPGRAGDFVRQSSRTGFSPAVICR